MNGNRLKPVTATFALLLGGLGGSAGAQTLSDVVVSANREAQRSIEVPASIQGVTRETIEQAGPQVNLSESMTRIPGVTVLDRQNYAQDLQLSIRGFGSRSTFGIRGVRLIVDGIPATMPDGQGQASTISLGSAARIEVLRGPLAQLYGNAAGGVVQAFTADGPQTPEAGFTLYGGSDGLLRYGLDAGGQSGRLNYIVDYSRFQTDGYRDHSAAERRHLNAKLRFDANDQTRVSLVANFFDQPLSEDPLGLTRAQFEADPRQAVSRAYEYDTGKVVSQNQAGVVLEHKLDADRGFTGRVYYGQRDLYNRLSIPIFVQNAPTAAGGIVDLNRDYSGIGLQYNQRFRTGKGLLTTTIGLDHDRMHERRRGYINNLGVQEALKRDEDDTVSNLDIYAQANWIINEHWTAVAGLRSSHVRFRVDDHFIAPGNPDDSGEVTFSAVNPVLGITRHFGESTNVYLNVGRGFETPTFTEIAYSDTGSGPNLDIRAAKSRHLELGLKTQPAPGHRVDVALFRIDTDDEIVVSSSSGGRSTYTNAGRTRRTGIEVAYTGALSRDWSTHVALSTLDAKFVDSFTSGGSTVVPAGNRLPGTAEQTVYAELAWHPVAIRGLSSAVELVHRGRIAVDDINSDYAEAATTVNLRASLEQRVGTWRVREYARVNNVGAVRYAGSVIVNDGNGRFFEPAPGRTWMLGVVANYAFGK